MEVWLSPKDKPIGFSKLNSRSFHILSSITLYIKDLYNIFLLLFLSEKEQILYKNNKIIENMTLYLIGIGLSTEKDITVKGLEIVKKCDKVYLESYTSLLQCSF